MMNTLLEALMSGNSSVEQTLRSGAKQVKRIGLSSNFHSFQITAKNGLTITELYPSAPLLDKEIVQLDI